MSSEINFMDAEEKPPLFKTWRRLYGLVIMNLIVCLIIFYLIRRFFE